MSEYIESSGIIDKYTSTGRHSGYQVNLLHNGLKEHKHLQAVEYDALLGKISNQEQIWAQKWLKKQEQLLMQTMDEQAQQDTADAQAKIKQVEEILEYTLYVDDKIDWDSLKHHDEFFYKPQTNAYLNYIEFDSYTGYPFKLVYLNKKSIPKETDFHTPISFFDKLLRKTEKIRAKNKEAFENALANINSDNEVIDKTNKEREAEFEALRNQWNIKKGEFEEKQNIHNAKVDELASKYKNYDSDAILEYCEMVLNNSEYPDNFPQEFEIQYNEANKMLLVDYKLPSIDNLPNIISVKYIKSRNETEEKTLSQAALNKLYDEAIYQIALRTLHELFEADVVNALEAVNFNGYVTAINFATGHEETTCIISVQSKKDVFEAINLAGIVKHRSFKECFKSLKGVGSAKLSTMTAVKPLIVLDKSDSRIREHYDVANDLNEEINIAAMGWEDFEHLVREIFQKEFTESGGEVKVTQTSADGGVDAIAFDPDPIRGGKIVIQAKRYTNVVGVAAVRDLYGTVMNEGATKGILVTTSDFGSDSYNFAKDKPLTLLNGSNLLYLLEKHGHKAKIDIQEAKRVLKEQSA
jgi:restriction system protein